MPCLTRTERCEQDLIELWVYIAQDNPAAADRDDLTDKERRALHEVLSASWKSAEAGRLGPASGILDELRQRR